MTINASIHPADLPVRSINERELGQGGSITHFAVISLIQQARKQLRERDVLRDDECLSDLVQTDSTTRYGAVQWAVHPHLIQKAVSALVPT